MPNDVRVITSEQQSFEGQLSEHCLLTEQDFRILSEDTARQIFTGYSAICAL